MAARTIYDLTNEEIYTLAKNKTAAPDTFKSYVKNLINAQGEKFLENTISSTYVLLNADNYQALLDSYSRQMAQLAQNRAVARSVRARLGDAVTSYDWRHEDRLARAQALAAFAVGVPLAGLAHDRASATVAYCVAGATVVVAAALYARSAVRTHRDTKKLYWATPGKRSDGGGGVAL